METHGFELFLYTVRKQTANVNHARCHQRYNVLQIQKSDIKEGKVSI